MSDYDWITTTAKPNRFTVMNSRVVLNDSGVNDLGILSVAPNTDNVIFGDYTKWVNSLIWYPINFTVGMEERELDLITDIIQLPGDTKVNCYNVPTYLDFGYTVGQYRFNRHYNDFRDFEPYTTCEIYLPYYGYANIKLADVYNKYLNILLNIDTNTGQAMYTLCASNEYVNYGNAPYKVPAPELSNARIIGKIVFQLGTPIPFGSAGTADATRNLLLGIIRTGSMVAASLVSDNLGGNVITKTVTSATTVAGRNTERNPLTNRQIVSSSVDRNIEKEEVTTTTVNRGINQRMSEVFAGSIDCINNMNVKPIYDKANNTFLDVFTSNSVRIVIKTCRTVEDYDDPAFLHLYGKPLGEIRKLSELNGYTEISSIHLDNSDISKGGNLIEEEKNMLQSILAEGVIFSPESVEPSPTYKLTGTWIFNENISEFITLDEQVIFDSDNVRYVGFGISPRNIYYYEEGYFGGDGIPAYINTTWLRSVFRYITFYSEQSVSKAFYDWFTSNAIQSNIPTPVNVAGSND